MRDAGGRNAIAAFRGQGGLVFRPPPAAVTAPTGPLVTGDPVAGEELATRHCGRCHMVNERTRMTTIGARPSFALLRGLADWRHRFETFYSLNPHPAFTQVAGVTPPFDESRPPPIVPLRPTVAEIDAILAYVAGLAPHRTAGDHVVLSMNFKPPDAMVLARDGGGMVRFETNPGAPTRQRVRRGG